MDSNFTDWWYSYMDAHGFADVPGDTDLAKWIYLMNEAWIEAQRQERLSAENDFH